MATCIPHPTQISKPALNRERTLTCGYHGELRKPNIIAYAETNAREFLGNLLIIARERIACRTRVEEVQIPPSFQCLTFLNADLSTPRKVHIDLIDLEFDLSWNIYVEEMYFAMQRNQIAWYELDYTLAGHDE
jgi:hypothetical protein